MALVGALHLLLITFYTAVLNPLASAGTKCNGVDYTPLDGASGSYVLPMDVPGTDTAGTSLPAECSVVATLRTPGRGRRARGRLYLPPFSKAQVASGNLSTTAQGICVVACEALLAAAALAGWQWCVVSYGKSVKTDFTTPRPHTRVVSTWSPFATPITQVTVDQKVDVMRSRKA